MSFPSSNTYFLSSIDPSSPSSLAIHKVLQYNNNQLLPLRFEELSLGCPRSYLSSYPRATVSHTAILPAIIDPCSPAFHSRSTPTICHSFWSPHSLLFLSFSQLYTSLFRYLLVCPVLLFSVHTSRIHYIFRCRCFTATAGALTTKFSPLPGLTLGSLACTPPTIQSGPILLSRSENLILPPSLLPWRRSRSRTPIVYRNVLKYPTMMIILIASYFAI